MPDDHYTITLDDGKYTVINRRNQLEFLRHGEAWPGAGDLRFTNVVVSMAYRVEELEKAIKDVLAGSRDESQRRRHDGIIHMMGRSADPLAAWEARLRGTLEQK